MISHQLVRGLRARARRGFTLIELIVVVLIIGILVAIAAVGYRSFVSNSQNTQATTLLTQVAKGAGGNAASNGSTSYQVADFTKAIDHAPTPDGTMTVHTGTDPMDGPLQLHVVLPADGSGLFAGVAIMSPSGNCFTGYVSGPTVLDVTEASLPSTYDYADCLGSLANVPASMPPLVTPTPLTVTATDDTGLGATGTSIDVDVLANDTVSDAGSGDTLTITSFTQPAHGTVTSSGGHLHYTSTSGYLGYDSFSYTATNTLGPATPSTATVRMTNTPATMTFDALSSASNTTCAVASGTAYCWGAGSNGVLGYGSTTDSLVPVAVDNTGVLAGKYVTAISVGGNSACAVADGKPYCWGFPPFGGDPGGLGDGTSNTSLVPVAVDTTGALAGKTVTSISTSYNGSTCVVASAKAYCWSPVVSDNPMAPGWSNGGLLGNGTTNGSLVPVAVDASGPLAGKTVTAVSAGYAVTCAVADGKAYCWGLNGEGQLGDGTTNGSLVPVAVDTRGALAGKTVTSINSSGDTTCVVASAKAYCWGSNANGSLGDGTSTDSLVPVAVDTSGALAGKSVTDVSTKDGTTCSVASSKVYCWGTNFSGSGELGNGTTNGSLVPVAVDTSGALAGKTVTDVSVGVQMASVCVLASGKAYCWGDSGGYGLFADGTTDSSRVPRAAVVTHP